MNKSSVKPHEVNKWIDQKSTPTPDVLAVEEPLEIRLNYIQNSERIERPLSVTMRTPGHDMELTLGFLYSEGIINQYSDIKAIRHCETVEKEEEKENVVKVVIEDTIEIDQDTFQRNFYTTSSCGVCGKSSIEAIEVQCPVNNSTLSIDAQLITELPQKLRKAQTVFEFTGGLHASALFDSDGNIKILREDVGRHNALDKVVGARLFNESLPLENEILLLSGRTSFELVQKAARAGISIICAVGAPSSLAVELAEKQGITLIGFLKSTTFNVYSHPKRIRD
jgi:FdhD protein